MNLILLIPSFIAGILIGLIIKNFTLFNIVKDVRIGELGNILLAITVTLFIPFAIAPWTDKRRHFKNYLIDELKEFLESVKKVQDKIYLCCHENNTNKSDKDNINLLFVRADHKYMSVENQLKKSYKKKTSKNIKRIKEEYMQYWKIVTGGELMNEKFMINISFCDKTNIQYVNFELIVKESIHLINSL